MTTTKLSVAVLFAAVVTANSGALSAESAPVDAFGDPLPPGALARMGTVRLRHGSPVITVAFSPDGRLLASGTSWGELRLWDPATGKLVRPLVDLFVSPASAIAFSPDGKLLAANRNQPGVWQVSTGKKLRDLEHDPNDLPTSLTFSPDGKELALGTDNDPIIWIFDPATGKTSRKITGHEGAAVVVVYSKDGKFLASGSKDKTARIWDAATGKEFHRFQEPEELLDVALSPDGTLLATKTRKAVRLWDVASGKEARRFEQGSNEQRSLAFSPDGTVLGSRGVLWDVATGKEVCRCEGALVRGMAFSPDGKKIAAGGDDNVVHLFDQATGKELPTSLVGWNHGTQNVVGFTPDGEEMALGGDNGGGIHLCETATGKEIREYSTDKEHFQEAALSPDGKTLAAATDPGTIYVWETATGKRLWRLEGRGEPKRVGGRLWAIGFAPDGRTFAEEGENAIRLWDAAAWKELRQFNVREGAVGPLFFMPHGKTLISTRRDETTRFWDVASGQERRERLKQAGLICAISPDGRIAVVYEFADDSTFHIQEVATGKEVRRLTESFLYVCAFSPDGKTLAVFANGRFSPEEERPILLLEVATWKVRMKLAGQRGMYFGQMAFSPDGRMLASGGADTTALVWDATGRMRGGRFETAALSPKELSDSWAALAGDDAAEAYRAIWALAAAPEQTLPLLKERLRPTPDADPKETARRMADLDGDNFDVREKAEKELAEHGDLVEPALRKALDGRPSPEVRRRVEELLEKLNGPRWFQKVRAVEALERIGTPGAEKVLREVAQGPPNGRLTVEAKASLERLSRRPTPVP